VTVYLVGAGPGDPGLLTVRGAELMARAGAVVHDRLVDPALLRLAPSAELYDVGKRPGAAADRSSAGIRQPEINVLLTELGLRLDVVVRLKGGDPYVFGRGGEEALALQAAGLDYEVVPGVSAVNGVPAYAGIPLTHRGVSASFTVVTGHGADGSASGGPAPLDWDALGRLGGTVVILMGVEHRAEIAARLIGGGRKPSTPVALVEQGTLPGQRTTRTTLASLGELEAAAPATIVVGEVTSLELSWYEARPLLGWKVAVTRTREQASQLAAALSEAGATPVEVPTIEVTGASDGGAALRRAAGSLGRYDWVVFTSANSVRRVLAEVRDARAFGSARVAAIGDGTARALSEGGIAADLVPDTFVAEALAEAFPAPARPGERVLLPRAAVARDVLPAALAEKGYEVDIVEAYRTVRPAVNEELVRAVAGCRAVTFSSSSSVTGWLELLGADLLPPVVACIGPITARTAREAGIGVTVQASDHSIEGLVQALVARARA
jgi:uroporphyrinogen III methyltransferase/synthase